MNEDFYIGWEARAHPRYGRVGRSVVVPLLALAVVLAVSLSLAQRSIGVSVFEWGNVRSFTGRFQCRPYPHLLVPRPGAGGVAAYSCYYLVKPFKFGLDREQVSAFDGKNVNLKGTLIYHGSQTMIEVIDDSIRALEEPRKAPLSSSEGQKASSPPADVVQIGAVSLGEQTLVGEIVDSKCYLGVMNPGRLTPHRACAIRCISGGIPPVLLVRQANGSALHFLLVSRDGRPVNQEVLELVAEPVQITGEVERQGELLILRAEPATYRRLGR